MTKKGFMITVVLLSVLVFSFGTSVEAREFASAKLGVNVSIPAVQQLTVIEPVAVNFSYPWIGSAEGQALVFKDVGNIVVESNSNWALTINLLDNRDFNISIRPANDPLTPWVPIADLTTVFSGSQGSNVLSWDIRIEELKNISYESGEATVQFGFTISRI